MSNSIRSVKAICCVIANNLLADQIISIPYLNISYKRNPMSVEINQGRSVKKPGEELATLHDGLVSDYMIGLSIPCHRCEFAV